MFYKPKSYLTVAATVLFAMAVVSGAKAQKIYFDPDSVFITTGINTEFDIELRVDANVTSLKTYEFNTTFDATRLDTVSVTEGPLLQAEGVTYFFCNIINDTILQIQGLVMGVGIDASGPGLLATVRLKVLDTGATDLSVISHETRDVENVLYPSEATGSSVVVNLPPVTFLLIGPGGGNLVSGMPGDQFDLEWTSSQSIYPGESISYTLEYGTSPTFVPGETTTLTGLTDTTHALMIDDLVNGTYYWRVTAIGDLHGFERYSIPDMTWFEFSFGLVEPEEFDLITPGDGLLVDLFGLDSGAFDWEDAVSIIPGDTVVYEFCLGPDPGVPIGAEITENSGQESTINIAWSTIPRGAWRYWRVNATNKFGLNTWSSSTNSAMFYYLCDLNHDGDIDIGDLTLLIRYLYITQEAPVPLKVADCDCSDPIEVDIGDLTKLISYLYIQGTLERCQ